MKYSIYLCNPFRMVYRWQDLCEELHKLFEPVIQASSTFTSHRVRSTMQAPAVKPQELLIYVVPSRSDALVQPFFEVKYDASADGCTAWHSKHGTGSEIYRGNWSPKELARLAYHEAMHNKLHKDKSLHGLGGLAAEVITASTKQKASNNKTMGQALNRSQKQWLGGFQYAHDPLRGA